MLCVMHSVITCHCRNAKDHSDGQLNLGASNDHDGIVQEPEADEGNCIMQKNVSQLCLGRWGHFYLSLGDGDGLEAVQLPQQAGALRRVQAVDELLGALRGVQGLHGLLQGVRAQPTARG